jgi:hypothetical protein
VLAVSFVSVGDEFATQFLDGHSTEEASGKQDFECAAQTI